MTDDGEIYTVVLYARVSTDDKGQTNETQIRELKQYCERKGYIIADNGDAIYQDEQTGKNDKRPGLRMLKGRISEGDIDYVLARNQDRISREPKDYQTFLDFCRQFRVRIRFSDNSSEPETAEGILFDSIQSGLAKADNIKRSVNTKKGMETARLKGKHCGRYLAFCWSDEAKEQEARLQLNTVMVDDHEVDHRTVVQSVDTVMDLARQGMSYTKASKVLGVSRDTLIRALRAKGIDDEYREIAAMNGAKGFSRKREEEPA